MSHAAAVAVNNLTKVYRDGLFFPKRLTALSQVSLEVKRGEIFGLLGPNGAGKTTLLKILLGIIRKSKGTASLLGLPAGSRRARSQVGFLPEHLRIPQHLTAFSALELYGHLHDVPTRLIRQRRGPLLELVGLAGRERDRVKKFSKGMLQRLGLAQALLNEPQLLILDEPTDGLDPRARAEMRTVIRNLRERGVTIFLNSHLLQEVELVCDRIAILDHGQLRVCGRIDEITTLLDQQRAQWVVQFLLSGPGDAIAGCFPDAAPTPVEGPAESAWRLAAPFADQQGLDACIDRLRAAGISILEITRQRATLEDAFLSYVAQTHVAAQEH